MAKWQAAEIIVQLKSDLHCGASPLGFISRTLPFVPAHIPFYAMIPVLARTLNIAENRFPDLENFLAAHLRFSSFFVVYDDELLFPWKESGLLKLEKSYLSSYYGVALDYNSRGALENRLFEKEVILSVPKSNSDICSGYQRTMLKGYVFWREGRDDSLQIKVTSDAMILNRTINDVILKSQWGGEINKGLGMLLNIDIHETERVFEGKFVDNSDYPALYWPANKESPFYLEYDENLDVQGKLMPLTGRRYDRKRGPGVKMDKVLYVWDAGWQMKEDVRLLLGLRSAQVLK